MNYNNLTIHQKIGLKHEFITNPTMKNYGLVMITFNFKKAIEFFLTDDLTILTK